MWLINTRTYALENIHHVPQYAILSHTWDDGEVSFNDMKTPVVAMCRPGWAKIAGTCRLAAERGLAYAWVDTCCIDKSSSAELTEAINSMFKWYQRSTVCYVYLSDLRVPTSAMPESKAYTEALHNSLGYCRWFTRGWTLQELLAPGLVDFFDADWVSVGTTVSLLHQLAHITNIDRDVLSGATALASVPVGRRMSWAAYRETTRPEDLAYCLLGIFGVNMPMIYGEGDKAFIRLQEAIAQDNDDFSLFAWSDTNLSPSYQPYQGILAKTPAQFANCHDLWNINDPLGHESRSFAITNRGVEFRTYLKLDRENGDYCMHLGCRDGAPGISVGPRAVVIRLLKTPLGFIRHRTRAVAYDHDQIGGYSPSTAADTWDVFPRSVKIPKLLSSVELQLFPTLFFNMVRVRLSSSQQWNCTITPFDPRSKLGAAESLSSSCWDPCTASFLTGGNEWFTGLLYLSFAAYPSDTSVPPVLLFCGFETSANPHASRKKPWVTVHGEAAWRTPDNETLGFDVLYMHDVMPQIHQMHFSRFLSHAGRFVRRGLDNGKVLRRSIANYGSGLSVSVSVTTMERQMESVHTISVEVKHIENREAVDLGKNADGVGLGILPVG
ncbi:heterokaryon incompatibility protein-domain-containing protein [Podospora appendiculata]|uniref:Heterokaryon incompatibility protein-domain-containing protein n=1 Tax=Podospora appendiculata TaxID=314037 RepID=A0AAE0XA10_9PEZI|nr:heterokaryon incompatibility protein-domain-containing protein [Podospora appendiculata]